MDRPTAARPIDRMFGRDLERFAIEQESYISYLEGKVEALQVVANFFIATGKAPNIKEAKPETRMADLLGEVFGPNWSK